MNHPCISHESIMAGVPVSRLVSWLVSRCPGGCPGLASSVSRLVSRCSGGCPGVAPSSGVPGCPGWCPGVRASRSEISVCSQIPIRAISPCCSLFCSSLAQESFRNHSLIIHSGNIQESFKNHSSIIMNQAQIPSFSSPWPRGVSMVSPIPRLSLHFLSYPLFIYVFRTDNDDRHVHVHVCACVCMCMCMCMVIYSCVSGPTTIIDTCMRMCVHVLIHCYSPPHLIRDGFR